MSNSLALPYSPVPLFFDAGRKPIRLSPPSSLALVSLGGQMSPREERPSSAESSSVETGPVDVQQVSSLRPVLTQLTSPVQNVIVVMLMCDDLFDSTPMSSRLSSCSLDSVIGYLDELLGRKEALDSATTTADQGRQSPPPTPSESKRQVVTSARRKFGSSPVASDNGTSTALAVQMDDVDANDSIQRVMDLSFASVYEMPGCSDPLPARSACQKVMMMTVLTESIDPPDSLDSGVESNKSDDESSSSSVGCTLEGSFPLHHDYQNLLNNQTTGSEKQQQQQRRSSTRRNNSATNCQRSSRTNNRAMRCDDSASKDEKFYEICLGHLCLQMEAGNSVAGTGLGFDRWISIFSLQKHQDELIQMSASPSSPPSSSSSSANHYHQSHNQQQQQQQPGKRHTQRHHSSGGGGKVSAVSRQDSRQESQDDSAIISSRNSNGKKKTKQKRMYF